MTATRKGPSGRQASVAAIAAAKRPLTVREIASVVVESKVCPGLKGKTPEATLAAQITGAAKRGVVFKRVGSTTPAKFGLRRDVEPDPDLVVALRAKVREVVGRQVHKTESPPAARSSRTPAGSKGRTPRRTKRRSTRAA